MLSKEEFDFAIQVHLDWIKKLQLFLHNPGGVEINIDVASDFNGCALGTWISTAGTRLNETEEFQGLVRDHKLFHTMAGDVILLVKSGQVQMATVMLTGQMTEISQSIVRAIETIQQHQQANK